MPITNPAAARGFEVSLQFGEVVLLVLTLVGLCLFIVSVIQDHREIPPAPKGDEDPDLEYLYDPSVKRDNTHPRH